MIRRINPIVAGGLFALAMMVFIGVCAVAAALLIARVDQGSSQNSQSPPPTLSPQTAALITQIPLALSPYEFATDVIDYPGDWPESLIYPDEFMLVEASSGSDLDGTAIAYTAKLRYLGETTSAATELTEFLMNDGWEILDRAEVEETQIALFFIRSTDSDNGMAILERDSALPGSVRILIVVSP